MTELWDKAAQLAEYITEQQAQFDDTGVGHLFWEWANEIKIGNEIRDVHLPKFTELYKYCEDKGYVGRKSYVYYGDMDVFVWIEPHDTHRVLVLRNNASGVDRVYMHTGIKVYEHHLSQLKEMVDKDPNNLELQMSYEMYTSRTYCDFHAREIGDKQISHKRFKFKDHRDIKQLSLNTLRKVDWEPMYKDFRDVGYCFSYEHGRVQGALYHYHTIRPALTELEFAYEYLVTLNEEDTLCES